MPKLTGPFPSVTVVIPAHNEVRRIGELLDSLALLVSSLPDCEVVVVDDRSTDGTATLARSYGVQVVEVAENVPSQEGSSSEVDGSSINPKARALQFAAGQIRGEVIVFFDADVVIRDPSRLLGTIMLTWSEARPLMVSYQPYHEAVGFVESLSLYPNVISLMASGAFTPLNALGITRVAFGPALVLRRTTYEAIGGHGAALHSILDDVALAQAVRSLPGGEVRVVAGRSGLSFRMYPDGLRAVIEGFGKNIAGGATSAPLYSSIGAGLWFAGGVAATTGLAMVHATTTGRLIALGQYLVVGVLQYLEARRVGRFSWSALMLLPLVQASFVGIFLLSTLRKVVIRRVKWRGQSLRTRSR